MSTLNVPQDMEAPYKPSLFHILRKPATAMLNMVVVLIETVFDVFFAGGGFKDLKRQKKLNLIFYKPLQPNWPCLLFENPYTIMSLSEDINSQQNTKTCFICEFEISNKNTTTVEKEGMFFHKHCYQEQFSLQAIENDQSSNKTPEVGEDENGRTNSKFIKEDICPLIQINKTNNSHNSLQNDLPDLLSSEQLFRLTPEIEKRKQNTLDPRTNDIKKVTFSEDIKIPAAELEYENSEEFDPLDETFTKHPNLFNEIFTEPKESETHPKQHETFTKHPNFFNEINICLECGNPIDFSKPNSFMPLNDTVAGLIDYSDNMLDNFNKLGENIAQNLPEVKDYNINFYLHINCATGLQWKKEQYLNKDKNNKFAQNKQNEIPEEKFNEVMKIMKVQKDEEISTMLKNLTIQTTNMTNVLCRVEQRIKQQQNFAEIDEQNRKELFSSNQSSCQEKVTKTINKQITNDQLRESVMQLAGLMIKFNEALMNFEKTMNNQEFMNCRRHEIIKEYFEKIVTEEENNKKRNELIVEIIQDVESTLSAKIFELSEKMRLGNCVGWVNSQNSQNSKHSPNSPQQKMENNGANIRHG